MKRTLLSIVLLYMTQLSAQKIPGITKVSNTRYSTAFIFKDQQQRLWSGYGGMPSYNYRQSRGLQFTRPSQPDSVIFNTGTFTDGLEWNNTIYIAADNGLYFWKNDTLSQVSSPDNCNTLQIFKDSLFIGTSGKGLFSFKNGAFKQQRIKIQGRFFDTINDLASDGKSLWLATNSGLLQYKDGAFSLIPTPVTSILMPHYERRILSVETDKKGRVWFSNASPENGINTFYIIDQSVVTPVHQYYNQFCELNSFLPKRIDHLSRARNGTILLGTTWGLIEFGSTINYFPVDVEALRDSMLITSALINASDHFYMAFEDLNGHYVAACNNGIFDIDRNLYSLDVFSQNFLNTFKRSTANININDIDASIANDGSWFNGNDLLRMFQKDPIMKLRSGSCTNAMFSSGLWLGGIIDGDTADYVSAQTYKQTGSDYISGPLNITTLKHDPELVNQYNHIWSVTQKDIDDFIANRNKAGYQIPNDILNWPGNPEPNTIQNMAPYVDVDQNNKYEPGKGDYPKIKGDQMLWWVFNDAINHSTPKAQPLKFQINAACYAYHNLKASAKDSDFLANRTLIFDFTIFNLNTTSFKDVYIGIMNDPDLGYYGDDYVSCDTILNIGYVFNADDMDDLPYGFGKNPPMVACQFLNRDMHYFTGYNNNADPISGNPRNASDFYRLMAGPAVRNLSIYKRPCDFKTSADPQGDRRFMMSSKIGEVLPGSSFKLNFAYFLQYDPEKNYLKEDCNVLQTSATRIKNWYVNDNFPSFPNWSTDFTYNKTNSLNIYPNPAHTMLFVETESPVTSMQVMDLTGRIMLESKEVNSIPIESLSEGIYQVRINTDNGAVTKKFIKQ